MNKLGAVLLLCSMIIIYYLKFSYVSAMADGRKWNVARFGNSQEAADLIGSRNKKLISFMHTLYVKYDIDAISGAPRTDRYKIVESLIKNYNPDEFYENDPRYSSDTSYTVNKGDAMHICTRSKTNPNEFVDPEMLTFVMLHEMAHIGNYDGWGHTPRFWSIFKFLLREASQDGTYVPVDYSRHPQVYCGLNVAYNPLFDPSVANI